MCNAALKRKGKGSDVEEADMEAVVHAHNSEYQPALDLISTHAPKVCHPVVAAAWGLAGHEFNHTVMWPQLTACITLLPIMTCMAVFAAMNELTWRRVLEWEALHYETCGDPKLLRFLGKPHDLRHVSAYSNCLVELQFIHTTHSYASHTFTCQSHIHMPATYALLCIEKFWLCLWLSCRQTYECKSESHCFTDAF